MNSTLAIYHALVQRYLSAAPQMLEFGDTELQNSGGTGRVTLKFGTGKKCLDGITRSGTVVGEFTGFSAETMLTVTFTDYVEEGKIGPFSGIGTGLLQLGSPGIAVLTVYPVPGFGVKRETTVGQVFGIDGSISTSIGKLNYAFGGPGSDDDLTVFESTGDLRFGCVANCGIGAFYTKQAFYFRRTGSSTPEGFNFCTGGGYLNLTGKIHPDDGLGLPQESNSVDVEFGGGCARSGSMNGGKEKFDY